MSDCRDSSPVPPLDYFSSVRQALAVHGGSPERITAVSLYWADPTQPGDFRGVVLWDRRQTGYGYAVYYTGGDGTPSFGTNALSLEQAALLMGEREEKVVTDVVEPLNPSRWEMYTSEGIGMPRLVRTSA